MGRGLHPPTQKIKSSCPLIATGSVGSIPDEPPTVAMYACGTQVIRLGLGKKVDVISQANSNSNSNKVKIT